MRHNQPDQLDYQLLDILQKNGRISNTQLAHALGISPAPCLRRRKALEASGYIDGFYGALNAKRLGFEVTVFAMVGLHSQAEADLQAFEAHIRDWPFVRECHMLNGEIDFILKCVAPSLSAFQEFLTQKLTPAPNVASVRTSLTIRCAKLDRTVPLEALGQDGEGD